MNENENVQIRDGIYMLVSLMYAYIGYQVNDIIEFGIITVVSLMAFSFLYGASEMGKLLKNTEEDGKYDES